tara:strand:- start:200 stop:460 length:261 start_codon:yes stop_codon:yes gene_type:complete
MTNEQLVSKVWNYAHVLRDQGISYGDYVEQITYLLFLKMDQERVEFLNEPSAIPRKWSWVELAKKPVMSLRRNIGRPWKPWRKSPD